MTSLRRVEWDRLEPNFYAILEPGVLEYDYYAPGVGAVKEEAVKGETELIELVEMSTN